jgi:DNA-binding protein H-NS
MSNVNLSDLLAQKAALEKQIADAQRAEHAQAIAQIRGLMSQYGLTMADISGKTAVAGKTSNKGSGTKVAAKYRNPATGDTWSGRGLKPKWLRAALEAGRDIGEFTL